MYIHLLQIKSENEHYYGHMPNTNMRRLITMEETCTSGQPLPDGLPSGTLIARLPIDFGSQPALDHFGPGFDWTRGACP